jgi:hypothetical protein
VKYVYLTAAHWYDDDLDYEVDDEGITISDSGSLAVIAGEDTSWFSPIGWFGVTNVAPKGDD